MSSYKAIKQMVLSGEYPTVEAINAAIMDQIIPVSVAAASLAKHAAKLAAASAHPFALPADQAGRVERRTLRLALEHDRLTRLYYWREMVENSVPMESAV